MALLIVDDSAAVVRACSRPLRKLCTVRSALCFDDAVQVLEEHDDWRCAIIDVKLGKSDPDGGLRLVEYIREIRPRLSCAMLSALDDRDTMNAAARHGALYFVKPVEIPALRGFVERALATTPVPAPTASTQAIELVLRQAAARFHLTPREKQIVTWSVLRQPREEFLTDHSISRSTWDKHVGGVLQKTGADSMEQLVANLLEKAMRR